MEQRTERNDKNYQKNPRTSNHACSSLVVLEKAFNECGPKLRSLPSATSLQIGVISAKNNLWSLDKPFFTEHTRCV